MRKSLKNTEIPVFLGFPVPVKHCKDMIKGARTEQNSNTH